MNSPLSEPIDLASSAIGGRVVFAQFDAAARIGPYVHAV